MTVNLTLKPKQFSLFLLLPFLAAAPVHLYFICSGDEKHSGLEEGGVPSTHKVVSLRRYSYENEKLLELIIKFQPDAFLMASFILFAIGSIVKVLCAIQDLQIGTTRS